MSQKSSLPQVIQFVSEALMPDRPLGRLHSQQRSQWLSRGLLLATGFCLGV